MSTLPRALRSGDLILWHNGSVAIAVRKVDIYLYNGVSSRSRRPQYRWLLSFSSGNIPYDYSETWGVSEELLLSGEYCEIKYKDKEST